MNSHPLDYQGCQGSEDFWPCSPVHPNAQPRARHLLDAHEIFAG